MDELWTLPELAARAAAALRDVAEQASARVREIPDARTIRWYQTTGLVDRPSALRGRTALYGRRQLLQLLAIKHLQAQGRSLAEIQAQLAGMSTEALEELVDLPAPEPAARQTDAVYNNRAEIRARFWTHHRRPDTIAEPALNATTAPADEPVSQRANALAVHGIRLADDVRLILDHPASPLDPTDIQAVREAAAPLLDALARRGLIANQPQTKEPA